MTPPRARLAAGLLGCALVAAAGGARGATFTVNSTEDMGDGVCDAMNCTLREAVDAANASPNGMDPDIIDFDLTATNPTITLGSPLPDITEAVSILGGTANVTIRGPGMARVVAIDSSAGEVVLMDVTITEGGIPVASGANLVFDQTAQSGSYAQVISSEGSLEKDGPDRLTLSGANTYSGGTTVTAGTLVGTTTSLQGDISVADGAELVFNQTADGSFAGDLSGGMNAVVRKQGAGPLTLGGDNAGFAGEFSFEDGTLFVNTDTAPDVIVNRGTDPDAVVLQQSFDGSFTGQITGEGGTSAGTVRKTGSGNVALGDAALSLPGEIRAGLFTVEQGSFTLTDVGIFDGEFRLNSGATLQGQSLAANVTGFAQLDGNVAPGGAGSVAELRTSFDSATFGPNSALLIDVAELADVDLFQATSVVVEPGARIELFPQGAPDIVEMPLLTTTDPITGNFSFDQEFFFFTVMLDQQPNQILLTMTPTDNAFVNGALTSNQQAVAEVLDTAIGMGELTDFRAAVQGIAPSDVPALLNALSGEIATSFATARLAAKQRLDRNLELAVRGFAARSPSFVPGSAVESAARGFGVGLPGVGAASGPGVLMAFAPEPGDTGFGAWLDGYGVFGTAEGSGGAGDVDYGVYGTTLGVDARLSEHLLVGAAAGYARVEPDLRSASGQGDVGQGALFAAAVWDRLHLAGWGRYAFGSYETERPIGFGVDVVARGSFDGWDTSGHGEVGLRVLELAGFELRPLGSVDYARLEQDGYTETGAVVGADSLNLSVPSQSWTSLVSGLGARVHRVWELDEGTWLVPELHGRWLHEFEDTERRVVPTLTGAGLAYSPFIRGAELSRDGFVAGIGWTVSSQAGLHVYGDYEVNWNPELLQHAIEAGFRFLF